MLTRVVDGVTVEMTAEEEAQVLAEWAANAAIQPTKQQREDAILATQGKGKDRLLIQQQVIAFVESQAPALATQYGVTVPQALAMLYERNKSYRECKDTEAACRLNDATT